MGLDPNRMLLFFYLQQGALQAMNTPADEQAPKSTDVCKKMNKFKYFSCLTQDQPVICYHFNFLTMFFPYKTRDYLLKS